MTLNQNATIQKDLSQKMKDLAEKDKELNELKERLKESQHEVKIRESSMQSQQNHSAATLTASEVESNLSLVTTTRSATQKEQELLKQLELLKKQSSKQQQLFDEERLNFLKNYESTEKRNRENIEKLRERHENDKLVFNSNILYKDREIEKLEKNMDEMRYNIRVNSLYLLD